MGPKVEAALRFVERPAARAPSSRPSSTSPTPSHGDDAGTVIDPASPDSRPDAEEGTHRARTDRGPQGPAAQRVDASELAKLIDDGVMEADRVIAVIGKTEGNGGVNDYTRIIADRAFREVLVEKGTRPRRRSSRSRSSGPAARTASSARTPRSSPPCRRTRSSRPTSRG